MLVGTRVQCLFENHLAQHCLKEKSLSVLCCSHAQFSLRSQIHALTQKVDFVLLGGDLFHDNKPSRQTVVKAMEIFARHCMSDDPVGFRVISDQRQNFASG